MTTECVLAHPESMRAAIDAAMCQEFRRKNLSKQQWG